MNLDKLSVENIDLSPKPGKEYWKNCHREWREEFIYFLLVDRFHDDLQRVPDIKKERSSGFGDIYQLNHFCGGTIRGISRHLDYIEDLGCTAIWLSPVFENDENTYHGYAIRNYLKIEPRFGSKEDLIELIEKAHKKKIKSFPGHCPES